MLLMTAPRAQRCHLFRPIGLARARGASRDSRGRPLRSRAARRRRGARTRARRAFHFFLHSSLFSFGFAGTVVSQAARELAPAADPAAARAVRLADRAARRAAAAADSGNGDYQPPAASRKRAPSGSQPRESTAAARKRAASVSCGRQPRPCI
jgi:hypothetical protein